MQAEVEQSFRPSSGERTMDQGRGRQGSLFIIYLLLFVIYYLFIIIFNFLLQDEIVGKNV